MNDPKIGGRSAPREETNGPGAPSSDSDIVNDPITTLDAWTALEVLSPQSYKKPEDLAGGNVQNVIDLTRGLPWGGQSEGPPSSYEIVLGAVKLDSRWKPCVASSEIHARKDHSPVLLRYWLPSKSIARVCWSMRIRSLCLALVLVTNKHATESSRPSKTGLS